jgi:nucleotide-binding universal stress UspA family protein
MSGPVEKILVYIDGTEGSITAAQYAICLSRATGAQLAALYVINTRALDDLVKSRIFLEVEQNEYKRDLEVDAERYLKHVEQLARDKGLSLETISVSGSPNQEIRRTVQDRGIDLLILPELAHIRSRRDAFFDEAERAMRNVNCCVLIVKDEERVWNLFESRD